MTVDRMGFIASASDLVPLAVGLKRGQVMVAPVWGPNMPAAEYRMRPAQRDQLAGKFQQFDVHVFPVVPRNFIILAIRVVIAVLGAAKLITTQQHRDALGQHQ